MSITPELWISNLIGAVGDIADGERQESRWLAPDAYAWERPEELMVVVLDGFVFDGFIEKYRSSFSDEQYATAQSLAEALDRYGEDVPGFLDPEFVLADPEWHRIRQMASIFVSAFKDKWPPRELVPSPGC